MSGKVLCAESNAVVRSSGLEIRVGTYQQRRPGALHSPLWASVSSSVWREKTSTCSSPGCGQRKSYGVERAEAVIYAAALTECWLYTKLSSKGGDAAVSDRWTPGTISDTARSPTLTPWGPGSPWSLHSGGEAGNWQTHRAFQRMIKSGRDNTEGHTRAVATGNGATRGTPGRHTAGRGNVRCKGPEHS